VIEGKLRMGVIPYGRQDVDDNDIRAVLDVLRSEWLTQGPAICRFERGVADYVGATHAVAVSSATAALHLSCLSLGLGRGDVLWTVPNTFVASANCALYCGASVDFVDIDPETYNMSVDALSAKLATARKSGRMPKVVVPVHFAGQSCDMQGIAALAQEYGFRVLEDASHAIGGCYRGEKIGSCRYSDVAVFSFHPVKIITTGEGGLVLTRNSELAASTRLLRTHGVTREQTLLSKPAEGAWYYEQIALGLNCRMTDIQAALGASQMRRIDAFLARRRAIAARYDAELASLPVTPPVQREWAQSAWHLYVIQVKQASGRNRRRQVFDRLREAGILVNVHYIPVHLQPYYQSLGFKAGDFPVAEAYYSNCITLPMYASLTDSQQEYVIEQVRRAVA
jgi:UDP-4-amino-4,6-dideoxy-N-acetyl-beta-L-altrosamine transaminase